MGATDKRTSSELDCAMTPPVRDDSASSHFMGAQLGRAETSKEVLNFSSREKVVAIGELRTE